MTAPPAGKLTTVLRWKRRVVDQDGSKTLLASNGQWTYRSAAATDAVGDEERPYTTLVFTGDANSSGTVNWQDAARRLCGHHPLGGRCS